jgi:hypothetical protein
MKKQLAQKPRRTAYPEIEVSLTMREDRARRSTEQQLWHSRDGVTSKPNS